MMPVKYANATDVLSEELLSMIQKYYQGGYLYIPKKVAYKQTQQTDYKIELEKRNQSLYLMHLEGRTNQQLEVIYHLSASSIRRIISKEKTRYQEMKKIIEQLLPAWGVEKQQLSQIYPSAWELNHSYVIKVYDNKKQLERNIKISQLLRNCNIPVAKIIFTKADENHVEHQNRYFLMSDKLKGSNISDSKDKAMAQKMGCAIAQLHTAFLRCEREIEIWDNSLLQEMNGWIRENLVANEWLLISKEEFSKTTALLETMYPYLPRQLIHRDVHFGNFLFYEGNFSGYIDFDLSQRNIRIFDICYFLAGLLAEETDNIFTREEWIESVKSVITGYESILTLSAVEKNAIPCVMECIEILFAAYFIGMKDMNHACIAADVFHFIHNCESEIKNAMK